MVPIGAAELGVLATTPAGAGPVNALSSALIALGAMMLIWLLLRWQWRRQRAMTNQPARDQVADLRQAARQREAEQGASAELVELSRRLLAQIDARSTQLEGLIEDADQRIEQLRGLAGAPAATPGRPPPSEPVGADPIARGVYELADEGLGPVEIARRLDQHVGAVELILALRPR
ncbi:MAG: hypothetical protein ACF8R7_04965 [Phycisphaerales bacterium JB039]